MQHEMDSFKRLLEESKKNANETEAKLQKVWNIG
jgi:hypothetical protein